MVNFIFRAWGWGSTLQESLTRSVISNSYNVFSDSYVMKRLSVVGTWGCWLCVKVRLPNSNISGARNCWTAKTVWWTEIYPIMEQWRKPVQYESKQTTCACLPNRPPCQAEISTTTGEKTSHALLVSPSCRWVKMGTVRTLNPNERYCIWCYT